MKLFTNIKEFKIYLEKLSIPTLRLAKPVEHKDYSNINWNDIKLEQIDDNGRNIINLGVYIDDTLEEGIALDVQLVGDYFQLHPTIHENLQGQGLGFKIYKKFIHEFGNIYSAKGRRLNPSIIKLLNKFKNNKEYTFLQNDRNDILIILNTNPDKNRLIKIFNNI